jgi:hypothetical protein
MKGPNAANVTVGAEYCVEILKARFHAFLIFFPALGRKL